MCDLNGKFTLCSCSGDIDLSKPHWKLYQNSTDDGVNRYEEYYQWLIDTSEKLHNTTS